MKVHPDYEEFLKSLNENKVRYLIIGAHALAYHGLPRATKDLDVWISPSRENAEKFLKALRDFFGEDFGISIDDVASGKYIYQFGVAPVRIDVVTGIEGVDFEEAWEKRVEGKYGDVRAYYISKEHLIRLKEIAGRPQDRADIERLKKLGEI